MQTTIIFSMVMFSLSMSISPGPVNMTILSSSLNHGFKKTFAFISGATIGFTLLLIFIGFGFSKIINSYPLLFKILEILGSFFIIYIGYKILSSKPEIEMTQNEFVLAPNFTEGFLLQWLNPKAWIACASGVALFSTPDTELFLGLFIVIYFFVCYISLIIWGYLGQSLSLFLNSRTRIQYFNVFMGSTLILLALYMMIK